MDDFIWAKMNEIRCDKLVEMGIEIVLIKCQHSTRRKKSGMNLHAERKK